MNEKTDAYAFGMIIVELLTGLHPQVLWSYTLHCTTQRTALTGHHFPSPFSNTAS
jgi:hypothetical protein